MYGKLFASMFRGSLYGKWQAIITFQQMIILADQDGIVDFTPESLSATTSIPLEIIKEGITLLESPDPFSRSPDEEGRRIVRLSDERAWGWKITNYMHYRSIRTAEERRAYHREYWHKNRKNKQTQPDSTITQQTQPIAEAEAEAEASTTRQISNEISPTVNMNKVEKNNVPYERIVALYHEKLPELPRCVKLTNQRKGYIRQRWLEDMPDLDSWDKYFGIVRQSKFLMGQARGSDNRPPFRADLPWLCRPENVVKVIEGKYHRG